MKRVLKNEEMKNLTCKACWASDTRMVNLAVGFIFSWSQQNFTSIYLNVSDNGSD